MKSTKDLQVIIFMEFCLEVNVIEYNESSVVNWILDFDISNFCSLTELTSESEIPKVNKIRVKPYRWHKKQTKKN